MQSAEGCRIREMSAGDLARVLEWRNHPDIRRFMLTSHEISIDEHQRWFERASRDEARKLLLAEEGGRAFGFATFEGVQPGGISNWGFYTEPGAPRGSGRRLGIGALRLAFRVYQLHKVCGQALGFNEASIRLHRSLGFRDEGVLREQHFVDGRYHDVICFGLLHREWIDPA